VIRWYRLIKWVKKQRKRGYMSFNVNTEQQIKETLKLMGLDLLVNEFLKKAEPIEFNQNK